MRQTNITRQASGGGPGCVPRLLLSAPAGPDTPPQRVAVAAANWQASPAHLLRAPLPGSAGRATATSSDPGAIWGESWARKARPAQPEPVGGALGEEPWWALSRVLEDPSLLPSSLIPFTSPKSLEGSHSEHSKMEEASVPGKGLRASWTGALCPISIYGIRGPTTTAKELLCASSELAVFDLRFLISTNPTVPTMRICPSKPWGCLIPWFSPTVGSSITVG